MNLYDVIKQSRIDGRLGKVIEVLKKLDLPENGAIFDNWVYSYKGTKLYFHEYDPKLDKLAVPSEQVKVEDRETENAVSGN